MPGKLRKQLRAWLDHLVGWAEIDSLCTIFTAEEILANRREWERFIAAALARNREHQQAPRSVGIPDRSGSPFGRQETGRAGVQNDRGAEVRTGNHH